MKLNIYNSAKSNSNRPSIKGTLHNALPVKDMGTQKTIATLNQDASNVPVIIRQSSANVKKDQVMFDVSSVAEIIQRFTRDVWSTRPLKSKTYPPLRPKIYTPPAQLQQTVNTQPGVTYAQATKTSYIPTQINEPTPPAKQRHTRTKKYDEKYF
jgi:hypothetical protein